MAEEFIHLKNLKVHLNQVVFMPNVGDPPDRPYGFVYYLTIENQTAFTIQIMARKWIVRDAEGETLVVEGEGVVGEKPLLAPGDSFTYNSCHVVGSDSEVKGAFYGINQDDGSKVVTHIPEFHLSIPESGP